MAEAISSLAGLVTSVAFALKSCTLLAQTVRSYHIHFRDVRGLNDELEALAGVLQALSETVARNENIDFMALKPLLLRCGNVCNEFGEQIAQCLSRSGGSRTSFRDWAKLKYMGGGIDEFRRLLVGYTSTISIALADANLRQSPVTAEDLEAYRDMINDATADLHDHLEGIDKIIQSTLSRAAADHSQRSADVRAMPPVVAERITREGLVECQDVLRNTTNQLEKHLESITDRLTVKSKTALSSPQDTAELERLQEESDMARLFLAIFSNANEHAAMNLLPKSLRPNDHDPSDLSVLTNEINLVSLSSDVLQVQPIHRHLSTRQIIRQLDDTVLEQLASRFRGTGTRSPGDGHHRIEAGKDDNEGTRDNETLSSFGATSRNWLSGDIQDISFLSEEGEDTRQQDHNDTHNDDEEEDEEQQADEAEIESILSNLPSLTAGSIISSSLSPGLMDDIGSDVLAIFNKDEDLRGLFRETPKRITHDKFRRNFLRLLRLFLSDIRKQSDNGEPELHQVLRILRYQSRNIASHICQEIFDLKAQSEALSSLALQVPDKDGQLISFLEDNSTTLEIADAPKGEVAPDDNSSGGESDDPETVQSYPIPLSDLKVIIFESPSFSTFRERYRTFLFLRSGPKSSKIGIPIEADVSALSSERLGPRIKSNLEQERKVSFLRKVLTFVLGRVRRFVRPSVKQGYRRIEWICDCGDDLYADFPESDGDSIHNLEVFLQSQADNIGRGTAPSHTSHPPGESSNSTSALPSSPVPSSLQPLSSQENNVSQASGHTPNSHTGRQRPSGIGRATHTSRNLDRAGKRFIELCVNTGEFQRQLAEIDVSNVESDAQLFDRIRERYCEVRSFRVKYFLLKPVDVHFVQFCVEDRYRVGILDKPMAIPSQTEMATEGYAYYPCPLKPPPIPASIFLHHLSNPGPHKNLRWGNRIPQKLHRSILQIQTPDNLVIGWGVHIIEGLNKFIVLMCTLAGLLVSGIVSVAWAIARDDVQGGFGIGAWLASVQSVVVMLVVTKWLET